jgi:pyruvate formate lyase activating enzyme
VLQHVLDAIRMVYERGFWIEVVTLIVPGFNDAADELQRAADFLVSVSPDIPWHVTAFHQDYKMTENANTTSEQLMSACEMGRSAGLRYVYAGNRPGLVDGWENTYCPDCGKTVVERMGYRVVHRRMDPEGRCDACGARIPGIWQ